MASAWRQAGVAAVAVLAIGALAASGETNQASKVGSAGTVVAASSSGGGGSGTGGAGGGSPVAPGTPFKVGDEVKLGDWSATVQSATDPFVSTNSFDRAKGRFVAVDLTVRNLSAQPASVSSLLCFELQDSTGRSFSEALVVGSGAKAPDGEVDPGGQRRGSIVYDVPVDATGLQLRFKCDLFSSGSAVIALS